MALRPYVIGVAMLATAVTAPAPAVGQSGDPEQGSPSGVIYEIPLDNARRDAAPKGGAGSGKNGGGQSGGQAGGSNGGGSDSSGVRTANGTISPIRSENGFGSSSTVPGVIAAALVGKSKKHGGKSGSGSGKGGNSGGGSGTPTMTSPAESLGAPKAATVTPTPSKSRAYLLLALAVAVAAGIGVAGRFVARRR
jgi:hypothetical protein